MLIRKLRVRHGFTLVELLVVIVIIGMLMALTSVAVWSMIKNAKQARILVEMDQLSQAMNAYKEKQIEFPPSLSQQNLDDRRLAFMRHLNLAYANSAYGTTVTSFLNLTQSIALAQSGTDGRRWGYNYLSGNTVKPLDLNTLDQAEALVFWLGGFPTPVDTSSKAPIAGRRLFGFSNDTDNPFKRNQAAVEGDKPLRFRTDPLFGFDEQRLVDNDADGWFEYAPLAQQSGSSSAPYVYFDAGSYTKSTKTPLRHYGYPRFNDGAVGQSSTAADLYQQFGMAVPMSTYFDPDGGEQTRWAAEDSFQIICAGLDGQYTIPGDSVDDGMRVAVYPTGFIFEKGSSFGTQGSYTRAELDNVTSLANQNLEASRGGSK